MSTLVNALWNDQTHLRQSEVQKHSMIHLQHMDFEDEFVVAFVQCAHRHLKTRERARDYQVRDGQRGRGCRKLWVSLCLTSILERRRTCLEQVSLKPRAMLLQASFRAHNDASASTAVKKRVILRTSLCHCDYTNRIRNNNVVINNNKVDFMPNRSEPMLRVEIILKHTHKCT